MTTRKCITCHRTLSLDHFETKGNKKGKFTRRQCRSCTQSQRETTKSSNPESYLKYSEMILNEQSLITPQKFYNEYVKDVTINDINNVCKKYFVKENFYICILGKNFPKINYMEKQLDNM